MRYIRNFLLIWLFFYTLITLTAQTPQPKPQPMVVQFGIVNVRVGELKPPITMNDMLKAQIDAHNRFSSAILEIRELDPDAVDAILTKYKIELDLKGVRQ